jgi:diphthamide biosynthesis enzyme Dph1/Dph2-like protein
MKKVFIESVKNIGLNREKLEEIISMLKKSNLEEINLTYSIQYYNIALEVKKEVLDRGIKIPLFVQVLGCKRFSQEDKNSNRVTLHIGSGEFHAINILAQFRNRVIVFNGQEVNELGEQKLADFERKKKAKINNYLSSRNVGVLISMKPGQEDFDVARNFIKEIEKSGKNGYVFLCNTLNMKEFENFQIDFWVNTACPRIPEDSNKILNIVDIPLR